MNVSIVAAAPLYGSRIFDAEDYGYEEPGIVHECHCENCGAQITYFVPLNAEEEEQQ